MNDKRGLAFLAIGVAFLAIGATGQRAFLGIGAAFLALGVVLRVRGRRGE